MDKAPADGLGFRLDKVSFSGGVGAVMALACIVTCARHSIVNTCSTPS